MGNDQSERKPLSPAKPVAAKTPPKVAQKPGALAPAVVKNAAAAKTPSIPPGKGIKGKGGFLSNSTVAIDVLPNEEKEKASVDRLRRFALIEAYAIVALSALLVLGQPMFEPLYTYYSLSPQKKVVQLVALSMPNMTNRAILAWAASGITELMTIGFGDFEAKMIAQKWRFTPDGWEAFVNAFLDSKAGDTFKENHLVLTTVPRETPVILSQGDNERGIYQWEVQMPIVMTYATNNNVAKKEKATVTLTIVRSPISTAGIAIERWSIGGGA